MTEKIKNALRFNCMAYDAVRKGFKRGMSEIDVKNLIISACGDSLVSGDFVGGVRSSFIEGDATDYVLKDGDIFILDLQFFENGIYTDTTRTFFIGKPTEEQKEVYDIVCNAKAAGESVLSAGVRACDVYKAVKTQMLPFEKNFPHHAGHQLGVEPVMQPQFLPEKCAILKKGMAVTLEPGLYFENRFGIRVEDNYIITETGFVNLFDYTLKIEDFIL